MANRTRMRDALSRAMRWREMFEQAERMAERYGRPMLALQYHQLALDWSEKVDTIQKELR